MTVCMGERDRIVVSKLALEGVSTASVALKVLCGRAGGGLGYFCVHTGAFNELEDVCVHVERAVETTWRMLA